jgi:hypothetical protein
MLRDEVAVWTRQMSGWGSYIRSELTPFCILSDAGLSIGDHYRFIGDEQRPAENNEANNSSGSSDRRDPIGTASRFKLPSPIFPLGGIVLFLLGDKICFVGSRRPDGTFYIAGWIGMLVGSLLIILWLVMAGANLIVSIL